MKSIQHLSPMLHPSKTSARPPKTATEGGRTVGGPAVCDPPSPQRLRRTGGKCYGLKEKAEF